LTVIIGAGITGLSIAYHLKEKNRDFIIIEKEKNPGGLCRNVNIDGYIFNYTGHFIHFRTTYVRDLVRGLVPAIRTIKRNSYIYLNGRIIPYPIQTNTRYLSFLSRLKIIMGYIMRDKKKIDNLEDLFISNFGRGLYQLFFLPYNEKLWKYPLKDITPDFLTSYVPKTPHFSSEKDVGYNAEFLYPDKGIGELVCSISKGLKIYRGEVKKIDEKYVYFDSGKIKYENLVSTIPLPELLKMISIKGEKFDLKNRKLVWNSVLCLNLGIKGKLSAGSTLKKFKSNNFDFSKFHWIYFGDKKFPFYRIGSLSNISSELAPEGCSSLWVEISYRNQKPDKSVVDGVIRNLELIGLFKKEAIDHISKLDIPYAYPIYDKSRERILNEIRGFFKTYNITLAGRFGKWEYSYIEESILEGKRISEKLCQR
jgi:protoporphyrinogen oxidase